MTDDPHGTVFPLPFWFVLACFVLFGCWPATVGAEPKYRAQHSSGAVITLHSEPCQLREFVVNLPGHATWEKNGKVSIGCWGHHQGTVMLYWDDKHIGHATTDAFEEVTGV